MRRNRPCILPRRRVFLGCEGESERGYGVLLADLQEERRKDIHVDPVLLRPGGGDPQTLVERARDWIVRSESRGDSPYEIRALLLDSDMRGNDLLRDERALQISAAHGIRLIWQEPCHEALLLRHFDGCNDLRPSTSGEALKALLKRWSTYEKGTPGRVLAKYFDFDSVIRAAKVEPILAEFLDELGFFI
jgi:hypothetical protein